GATFSPVTPRKPASRRKREQGNQLPFVLAQRAALEGRDGVVWPSSCSRNAHDKNVLIRRAQSRIDQATLENEMGNWEDARSEEQCGHPAERVTGRARKGIDRLENEMYDCKT
ncbi:MAG: hypothetical protein ABIU05_00360, partial [Nitrospirales bacterium]